MASFTQTGVELVVKNQQGFKNALSGAGGAVAGFGKTAIKAVAGAGLAVAGFGAAVGVASVNAAISFESAFAGVIKTTDGLTDEFGNVNQAGLDMQQSFRDLAKEIPTSVEELLALGEAGGQLGITADNLVGFAETMAAIGEATNLTGEEAATAFAQIANVMQTPQDQIENMASSVVALGNSSATTEKDILNFAQRIAGAGTIAGLTEADVFGIGAAFSSVGVSAEAGGTAVQKVLLGMNDAVVNGGDQLEIFAATAGQSAEHFSALWERDASMAFYQFVDGLGDAGDDATLILDELGLKDQRLIKSFLSLASAGDLLYDTLETSSDAFKENTALTKEAEARYRTTESQMKIFKNRIKDVGITIGSALLPMVNKALQAAMPWIEEFGKRLPGFLQDQLIPAIKTVAQWLGQNLPIAVQFLSDLWRNVLLPALQIAAQWLSTNIPIAVQFLSDLWSNTLLPAIQAVWAFIQESLIPAFQSFVDFLSTVLPPIVQEVTSFIRSTFAGIVEWFQTNLPLIRQTVETVLSAIKTFWETNGQDILTAVNIAWGGIQTAIQTAIETVQGIITTIMQIINGDWDTAWNTIKDVLFNLWEGIKTVVSSALGVLYILIPIMLNSIKNIWENIWNGIKTFASNLWEDIKSVVGTKLNTLRVNINTKMNEIKTKIETIWNDIKTAISDKWEEIKTLVNDKIEDVITFIEGLRDRFVEVGENIVNAIREGISNAWDDLTGWFKDKLDDLTDLLPWSEPKDASSPLRGLSKSGAAIVNNLLSGLQSRMPALQAQLAAAITAPQVIAASPMAGGGNVTNNNINITLNNSISSGIDQAVADRRIIQTITNAIGLE